MTFLVAHLYLVTTGHTVTSNLKAMITGYEELETDSPSPSAAETPTDPLRVPALPE
jgi:hypothetical protein